MARSPRSNLLAQRSWSSKTKSPGVKLVILLISSDPGLDQSNALVRIKEAKDRGQCLVSVAEREGDPSGASGASQKVEGSPNYLSLNEEDVQNAGLTNYYSSQA